LSTTEDEFRPVVGYESRYEINRDGVVRTIEREVRCHLNGGGVKILRRQIKKPEKVKPWMISLRRDGGHYRTHRLSELVAKAFPETIE